MIHFGTGGFRAVIGEDFTRANINLLSQALANKIHREGVADAPFIIGYDRRFMSDIFAKWVCSVMAANGIHARLINQEAPTPLIMFTVKETGAAYGMAVTASHNPAEYNGIKVFTQGGRDATATVTTQIEEEIARITSEDVRLMEYEEIGRAHV